MVAPVVLLLRKLRWENRLSSQVQDQPMQQSKTSSQIKKGLSVRAVCPTCQQWHWNKSPAIISSNQTDPFITFNSSPCLEGSCLPNRATLAGYFPCWQLPWTGFPSQPTVVADLTPVFPREPSGTGPAPPPRKSQALHGPWGLFCKLLPHLPTFQAVPCPSYKLFSLLFMLEDASLPASVIYSFIQPSILSTITQREGPGSFWQRGTEWT